MILFSWLFIGVMTLFILVPFFRRRSDLLTPWNLFLVGSMFVIGWDMILLISSQRFSMHYMPDDYQRYCLGVIVFYATTILTYYKLKLPRRVAGGVLLTWPPANISILYLTLPFAALFVAGTFFPPKIEGVVQLLYFLGLPALAFTVTLSFYAWWKQRGNLFLLAAWVTILLVVLVLVVKVAFGRRPMLSALMGFPICIYWLSWRYWKPVTVVLGMGAACLALLVASSAFMQVRTASFWQKERHERGLQTIKDMFSAASIGKAIERRAMWLGSADSSLLCIHMYTRDLSPQPFHAAYFAVVNPIPRAFWPNKPQGLGKSLPMNAHLTYGLPKPSKGFSMGPGIIGHGYHEGGPLMLVFYGLVVGFALRFLDELLMRQSTNPYVLAGFAAISGNLMGWPRGDIGTFTVEIIGGCLLTLLLRWIGLLIFGAGLTYPRTSDLDVTRHGFVPRNARAQLDVRRGGRRALRGRTG